MAKKKNIKGVSSRSSCENSTKTDNSITTAPPVAETSQGEKQDISKCTCNTRQVPRRRIILLCCLSCCGGIEPTSCPVHPDVKGKKGKKEQRKKDKKEKPDQRKKGRNQQKKEFNKGKQQEIEHEPAKNQSLLQRIRQRLFKKKTTDQKAAPDQKQDPGTSPSGEQLSTGSARNEETVCTLTKDVHSDMQNVAVVHSASETGNIRSETEQTGHEPINEESKDADFERLKEDNMLSNTDAECTFKAPEELYSEEEEDIESKIEKSANDTLDENMDNSEGNESGDTENTYQEPPIVVNDIILETGEENRAYDQPEIADKKEEDSDWEIEF